MRRRLVIIVSAGLNIILALILFSPRHNAAPAAAPVSTPPSVSTNVLKPQVLVRKQFFSWSEVESPDYRVYIARLREIGCPEQTIRDIVVADVNQLYARKKQAEVVLPDQQWWRSTPDTNVVQAANAKLRALDQERRALLTSLLGPNWEAGNPESLAVNLSGPILGELPIETKQSVQDILGRSVQRTQDYLDSLQKSGKSADPAQLARLEQQMRDELSKVLTPAQLDEVLLRYSLDAGDLRNQLRGFEVSPDEFRSLFHARDAIVQQLAQIIGDDAASASRRAVLQKQFDDVFKTVLGATRFQAYQLSQDQAYQNAVAQTRDANAAPDITQRLYRVNLAAQQEQDRINNDSTLTPEQKAAQLQAVAQTLKDATDLALGRTPTTPPPMPPTSPPTQTHTFTPGETIDMIAARYGVSANAILNANPNLDPNALRRGTPIKIPVQQ